MMDLMSDPAVKPGLALLVLIVLAALAVFLVSRLRDYTAKDWDSTREGLSNFEEMRLKGDISEEEFRTIQAAAKARNDEVAPAPDPERSDESESDRRA